MNSDRFLPYRIRQMPGSIFLLAFVLSFPALLAIVLTVPKGVIHLKMNAVHSPFLDVLMQYWTWLGDGKLLVFLVAGLLLVSFRHFLTGLSAFAIGGLGAQVLKRLAFSDLPRPVKYFELAGNGEQLYLVDGVDMYTWLSFPSGHTSTAFALAFAVALMVRSKLLQALLYILALGVGYSRIYLSQHFLADVVGGAFLGIISGWIAWLWIKRYERNWMDLSIRNFIKRSN